MKNKEIKEAMDALKKLPWLEEENKKLRRENKILRFDALSTLEKSWAERAFRVIHWSNQFNFSLDNFKCDYIDKKDFEINSYNIENLCDDLIFD